MECNNFFLTAFATKQNEESSSINFTELLLSDDQILLPLRDETNCLRLYTAIFPGL